MHKIMQGRLHDEITPRCDNKRAKEHSNPSVQWPALID